jgi:hypothetical protein
LNEVSLSLRMRSMTFLMMSEPLILGFTMLQTACPRQVRMRGKEKEEAAHGYVV